MRAVLALLSVVSSACLVRHAPPDAPPPSATQETRRSSHPDGSTRSEAHFLVWSDGRVERDGPEREYFPGGKLEAERFFVHDAPTGLWRTWFVDGTPRSEVDHGTPGTATPGVQRFWFANGQLAAEGQALSGVREGRWSYWSESGVLLRTGDYHLGKREGPWSFNDESGAKRAEGLYVLGVRVGSWTLWDEHGEAHVRPAAEVQLDEP